jgi:hypothetical protein
MRVSIAAGGLKAFAFLAIPLIPAAGLPGQGEPLTAVLSSEELVLRGASWKYFRGVAEPSAGSLAWTQPGFNDAAWQVGNAGFGYADGDDATVLADMAGGYSTLYLRKTFQVADPAGIRSLELAIDYDDGFIAYLNGVEVLRKGVGKGSGREAQQVKSHDALKFSYFPIKDFDKHLRNGRNMLAIEGHNTSVDSHDFLVDPYLLIED